MKFLLKNQSISSEEMMNSDLYVDRLLTKEEIDQTFDRMYRKRFEVFSQLKEKGRKFYGKFVSTIVLDVMLTEMMNPYYANGANVLEFIDIGTHMVYDKDGNPEYRHVENLCIWQNGFYQFNCFNLTIPSIKYGEYQKKISSSSK